MVVFVSFAVFREGRDARTAATTAGRAAAADDATAEQRRQRDPGRSRSPAQIHTTGDQAQEDGHCRQECSDDIG